MCGRLFIKPGSGTAKILASLDLESFELPTLNNVAPSETIPVIGRDPKGELAIIPMRWWLHPSWSKEPPTQKYATFNARIETVLTSPSFRSPIKHHRAIIPAAAFIEWQTHGKAKTPFYIEGKTEPLCMAAIFDVWDDVISCAIITQPADDRFAHIHDRMPLALTINQAMQWLDQTNASAELVQQLKGECIEFAVRPIDPIVNNARNKSDPVFL